LKPKAEARLLFEETEIKTEEKLLELLVYGNCRSSLVEVSCTHPDKLAFKFTHRNSKDSRRRDLFHEDCGTRRSSEYDAVPGDLQFAEEVDATFNARIASTKTGPKS